jgi:hypothetical protein
MEFSFRSPVAQDLEQVTAYTPPPHRMADFVLRGKHGMIHPLKRSDGRWSMAR